ncbi:MAG TPA: hypothetical protein VKU02_19190 [Gemmataceae bacterium]|nr:hypothetical protein [Gemmataceae bacterium]
MRLPSTVFPMLRGAIRLGVLAVFLLSGFSQGLPSACADNKKHNPKPAPAPQKQKSPAQATPALPKPHPHVHKHPHVLAAMRRLHEAWVALEKAPPVFGAHQLAAMELIVVAYTELNLGVQGPPGQPMMEAMNLRPLNQASDYPTMKLALTRLHQAQTEAKQAAPMQGHRQKSIVEMNAAILQIEEGLVFARTHR